jgi:WD40 repeat protein/transcriptional regulator with XRE-family HTH domain
LEHERFNGLLLRYRGRAGLTQRELAWRIGVSIRTIQGWEAGLMYPGALRLQALISALLETGGLRVGHETEEAEALWMAVDREASRAHPAFERDWFSAILAERGLMPRPQLRPHPAQAAPRLSATSAGGPVERRSDWGDAPAVEHFIGRIQEVATIRDLVLHERCRVIGLVGMGGIGKTALAAKVAREIGSAFVAIYWRSLRDAPPVTEWLSMAIDFLSDHRVVSPAGEAYQLACLLTLLRERPILLVLDNFETLLEAGQRDTSYRAGFSGYDAVLQAAAETNHQSCLVFTSRETPPNWSTFSSGVARTFELGGLDTADGQRLLSNQSLSGDTRAWANLIARYAGNGLALKVVGDTITHVFGGDIGAFLEESVGIFGGIKQLLDDQIKRSSPLEQHVLKVLAVEREPVSIGKLLAELGPRVRRLAGVEAVEAVEALRRRSLVEQAAAPGAAAITLQSVVLEYVTDRLIEEVSNEVTQNRPVLLVNQPLIKAQAKDYVRQTEERLIGGTVVQQLKTQHGAAGTEHRLLSLLDSWRGQPGAQQGYGPGNVVNLLRLLRGNLRGADLSSLALRQAYLAEVDAQDANLTGAQIAGTVLADAFNLPISVALSSDGTLLAAGTSTGQIGVWRVVERTPLWLVQGHTGEAWAVALSADGRLLASAGADATVRLWETASRLPLATLRGHSGAVYSVALSANGQLVASGGEDRMVRLWEAALARRADVDGNAEAVQSSEQTAMPPNEWRPVGALQGHTGTVYSVALSADGRLVASGGEDRMVRLSEFGTGRLLATLQGHTGTVRGVALSADGRLVGSAGEDRVVRLCEIGGRPVATLQGHTGTVRGMALSADGQLVASSGAEGMVRLWETSTGRPLATLQGHPGAVWGMALSADGRLVATSGADGTVRLWETSAGRPMATLQAHTGTVWGVALAADGQLVASSSADGTVRLWETSTGRPLATLQGHIGTVHGVALAADRQLVASTGADGTVRLWETRTGRPQATLQGHIGTVYSVALSADGRLVASSSADGTVRLWDARTGRPVATMQGHTGTVWSVALSDDGKLLVSGGFDGTVRLWETGTGRPLATLQGHAGAVRGVAASADGGLLASGGFDGTVRLWQSGTGRPVAILQGHTGAVRGVALSADGQLLASGGFDGTVRLWQPGTATLLRTLQPDRRYERMNITGLSGITAAQHAALLALGASEQHSPGSL